MTATVASIVALLLMAYLAITGWVTKRRADKYDRAYQAARAFNERLQTAAESNESNP